MSEGRNNFLVVLFINNLLSVTSIHVLCFPHPACQLIMILVDSKWTSVWCCCCVDGRRNCSVRKQFCGRKSETKGFLHISYFSNWSGQLLSFVLPIPFAVDVVCIPRPEPSDVLPMCSSFLCMPMLMQSPSALGQRHTGIADFCSSPQQLARQFYW